MAHALLVALSSLLLEDNDFLGERHFFNGGVHSRARELWFAEDGQVGGCEHEDVLEYDLLTG